MHNIIAFLTFLFGFVYASVIGYLAWFSPKGYARLLAIWKKWTKATSIFYSENFINILLSPSGIGLWIIRIIVIPAIIFCIRGLVFGIWGK
jgi:hypothetical protein